MKFVDVNPYFHPYMGGIEYRMHDTARLMTERGHDVTILTSRLPGTKEEEITQEGYRIVRLDSRYINVYNPPIVSSKNVLETLESLDADIVNYNYRWAPSYSKDLRKYEGKKVFTYHNMWGEGMGLTGHISEINDRFFKKTLDSFDHIIAVSDYVRRDLLSRGYASDHVTAIPNCLNHIPEISNEEGDFVLSLGRLVETKGLKYLIDAMQNVDFNLIICGKGPEEGALRRQVAKLGLEDKIDLRGYVSEEEKVRLMSACKFFVMPSLFESMGIAAIELMSHGRPIVATDVDGLPDTVGNGGIIVPPRDSTSLAKAINELLKDDEKRKNLGIAARTHAESFDWKYHMDDFESVLLNVISN